jgi:8-oxo-dGTP diphosphatase
MDETLDQAAARELQEETGLEGVFLEQLHAFSAVDRDPRERVVSVAYYALVPQHRHALQAASDAADARWFPVGSLPSLAFDHAQIIRLAIDRLRHRLRSQPLGFDLLPRHFTLSLLQQLYEAVMGHELDKRNFRKKVLAYDLLIPLDRFQANVRHRAARLYRFDRKRYQQLSKTGFYFEVGS